MLDLSQALRLRHGWLPALLVAALLFATWSFLGSPDGRRSGPPVAKPGQGGVRSTASTSNGLKSAGEAPPAVSPDAAAAAPVTASGSDAFTSTSTFRLASRPQSQLPELPNGCEVTALSMLLDSVGVPVSKSTLAEEQPTDATQPQFGRPGGGFSSIQRWGNPNRAFVGRVTGKYGYGIYHGPLRGLLDSKTAGRALDLSGHLFSDVLAQLRTGVPVLLWTTTTMRPPTSWVWWGTTDGPFRATREEHAVLLVGYSPSGLVIDDPLPGRVRVVSARPFIAAWRALGRQALSVRPATK